MLNSTHDVLSLLIGSSYHGKFGIVSHQKQCFIDRLFQRACLGAMMFHQPFKSQGMMCRCKVLQHECKLGFFHAARGTCTSDSFATVLGQATWRIHRVSTIVSPFVLLVRHNVAIVFCTCCTCASLTRGSHAFEFDMCCLARDACPFLFLDRHDRFL